MARHHATGRPETTHNAPAARSAALPALPATRPLVARYPNAYAWYVFVSTLDLMFTNMVITEWDATEVNRVAAWVIATHGWPGLIAFKFFTVILVVAICEIVGAARPRLGSTLAKIAVGVSAAPVAATFAQLFGLI